MSDTAQAPQSPDRRTFAVVDGNSLMHRAFHAVPPTMNAPDGRPTNAIFGFLNMFLKMIDAFRPDGVAVAFDKGKPRVRMEMLPQYKAQRPPMDPDLRTQFPMIKELLQKIEVPSSRPRDGRATTSSARARARAKPPVATCSSSPEIAICTSSPPNT